jgi:hypothetical protein
MVDERSIFQGLVQRGLPPHIAQGFVMNMRDESGLNPSINEVAPLVPGSRGGFGLYQLTGPRRVAYEQFANARGVDPANVDAQLDFLVSELQGPESRAARSIFAAQDVPSAAAAIARDFLRPAPENLQRRVAQYTGGTTMQPQGLLAPTMSGRNPEQERQPFLQRPETADLLDRLAIGFEGMSLRPSEAFIRSTQERITGRREAAQTQQQRNATASWLESQGLTQLAQGVRSGAITGAEAMTMAQGGGQEATAAQRNYEFLISQGVPQTEALQRAFSGGTTINMPGAPTIGTIPPGYQAVQDPQTGRYTFEPIAGGPVATERAAAADAQSQAAATAADSIALIDAVLNDPNLGAVTGMVQGRLPPLTQAGTDLVTRIEQLQGQAFLQAFESLKGGGAITEREGLAAQNAIARLNRAQSREAFEQALKDLRAIVERGLNRASNAQAPGQPSGGTEINGVIVGDPYQ